MTMVKSEAAGTAVNWLEDPLSYMAESHARSLPPTRGNRRFNAGEHLWLGGSGARLACEELAASGMPDMSECFTAISRGDGRHQLDYGEIVALSGDFYASPADLFD